MCGRYTLSNVGQLPLRFELAEEEASYLAPRYNIAPSQDIPVIIETAQGRDLAMMQWGFRPAWRKETDKQPPPINARAETLLERPMFRSAVSRHRCLIPADGFYEWQASPGSSRKQPYYMQLLDGELFALAGIYTEAQSGDELARSCAIITTSPNALMVPIHNRMPVILSREAEAAWLDPELTMAEAVTGYLQPYPAEQMRAYPVSSLVSSVRNDGPELMRPLDG
jgi:putative SOS response-associated peptidase YedK